MKRTPHPIRPMRSTHRKILATGVITIAVAMLASTLTIPFLFESPSMFYKFGWDKTLLRAGKMLGLATAVLVFIQLVLAGRLIWLDRIFSLPTLYITHRYIAYAIVILAVLHPILILISNDMLIIPFEARYWPEWVGAGLWVLILLQFAMSRWRPNIFRAYHKWLLLHRVTGVAAMALLTVHMLYVSETFEHDGLPRNLVTISAAALLTLWLWVRLRGTLMRRKDFRVESVTSAGQNAHTIELSSITARPLAYLPGQFAFLALESVPVSKEPHPFTIASSPLRPGIIQFTIRGNGDWTRQIERLEVGGRAFLQGPFGHFSHLLSAAACRDIIMIAGGIGITPMISMLRYMADAGERRRVTLVWSTRTRRHLFGTQELDVLTEQLTDFTWIPNFTREGDEKRQIGRLDRHKLESLFQFHDRDAAIFLCGPPPMIRQVRSDLRLLGFKKKSIYFETFGL